MFKSFLLALAVLTGLAYATTQDVNVTNSRVPASQYGNWGVSILNLPPNFGSTQNGNWNVGQAGQWYMGQYGNWSVHVLDGLTLTVSANGITITPAGGSLTVTVQGGTVSITAGTAIPVNIVGGTSANGTVLPVTATATISTNSGTTTAGVTYGLNLGFDSATNSFRREYLGSAGDNVSSLLFPGVIDYGIYSSSGTTLTSGQVGRLQMDPNGRLLVSNSTSSSSLPTGASVSYLQVSTLAGVTATAATLSALNSKVTAVNTGAVVISSGVAGISVTASQGGACAGCSPWPVSDTLTGSALNDVTGNLITGFRQGEFTITPLDAGGNLAWDNFGYTHVSGVAQLVDGLGNPVGTSARPLTVSGSVSITGTVPLPTGAATESTLSTLNGKVVVVNTGAVSVSSSALPAGASTSAMQTTANSTLSNIQSAFSNVTVNAHSVTQGGPWTVSGSVGITSGVAGISVTASQGGPFTVSGSVGITGTVPLPTGAATEATLSTLNGKVTAVNTGAVVISGGVAGISVTASQGSPFTVSGSVGITGTLPLPTGAATESTLSILNGKVTAVNTGAVVISGGVAGVSVTATQGSPFTVSGSVGITGTVPLPTGASTESTLAALSATALSISTTAVGLHADLLALQTALTHVTVNAHAIFGNVSLLAGTATLGNVGITSTVQVLNAGGVSVTNTVLVNAQGSSVTAAIVASDGSLTNVTWTPETSPVVFKRVADSYAYAYSPLYNTILTAPVRKNNMVLMGSMSPTATDTNAFYMTPSVSVELSINNYGTGAGTVWLAFTNSATAITSLSTTASRCYPVPGLITITNPEGTWAHYVNNGSLTITGVTVLNTLPYMTGSVVPQTVPYYP